MTTRADTGPRTGRCRPVILGLLLATLAAAPAARADLATPLVSGLNWRSGASAGGFPCLDQLRDRPLDALTMFIAPPSFAEMVANTGTWLKGYGAKAPLLVVSLALLPQRNKGQFAQCAAGAFDGYFRQVGANLKAVGARGVVVRLGWEANIGSRSHPWGVDSPAQVPAYRACWRRTASALKHGGPGLLLEWTNAKRTQNKALHVTQMYPGDDVVDVMGVHYYDTDPVKSTQATWDRYYDATYNDGPWGLGTWLKFARSHRKRLGVGEWGIKQVPGQTAAQADDPVYMDNMYRFFRDNAKDVAYETYLNGDTGSGGHQLCPGTSYPRALATYVRDWRLGR